MNREKKEQVIKTLKDKFDRAKAIVFTDYRGLTVSELSVLRRLLREGNFEYKIVKNTLAQIASEGAPISAAKDSFRGPIGVAISYDNPVLTVKKVLEFSKKNDKLKVSIGVIEGALCMSDDLRTIAEIPPRNVLLSMLAGGFAAPLNKMACALNATLSSFVYAMEALKSKKDRG